MQLFCLPHAGGNSSMYEKWKNYLNPNIKLIPVELKGRGSRSHESHYQSFENAVSDIYDIICNQINHSPYAIFGHSMGAWLVYELYFLLSVNKKKLPDVLFFSGKEAPSHSNSVNNRIHDLPYRDFKNEVVKFGGLSDEVVNNKQLFNYIVPILRSDYRIIENYFYQDNDSQINSKVVIMKGKKDNVVNCCCNEWSKSTKCEVHSYEFDGSHFFIHEDIENVVLTINQNLCCYL